MKLMKCIPASMALILVTGLVGAEEPRLGDVPAILKLARAGAQVPGEVPPATPKVEIPDPKDAGSKTRTAYFPEINDHFVLAQTPEEVATGQPFAQDRVMDRVSTLCSSWAKFEGRDWKQSKSKGYTLEYTKGGQLVDLLRKDSRNRPILDHYVAANPPDPCAEAMIAYLEKRFKAMETTMPKKRPWGWTPGEDPGPNFREGITWGNCTDNPPPQSYSKWMVAIFKSVSCEF